MSTTTQTLVNSLKLIDGTFTPMHTEDLLKSFINTKINYHKLHRLIILEGDHNNDTAYDNNRIHELKADKIHLSEIIAFAKANNKNIKLKSTISIELTDQ
ncbi:hypothetical protein [Tenacibaculum jejuense]|uniref:Uncharacterized protein n=1 Tax=Tenacibaculum jejuense TaxID=584609 RepID=A0A238UB51_9FLAO|nr:hypothetical protein [Tenacibaculum jejuense]SNR15808.1 conserved protein of unknown function [Tenacibaculum jejuense]